MSSGLPQSPPPINRAIGLINPINVHSADHYVAWISMTCSNSLGGDAACCIEFHPGPAANGRIVFISNALLLSPEATAIMADTTSCLCQAVTGYSPRAMTVARFSAVEPIPSKAPRCPSVLIRSATGRRGEISAGNIANYTIVKLRNGCLSSGMVTADVYGAGPVWNGNCRFRLGNRFFAANQIVIKAKKHPGCSRVQILRKSPIC
jgi:hypothetical protein